MIKADYDNLTYVRDTPYEEIQNQQPIKEEGLYFMYDGEKREPGRVWFGCHFYRYDIEEQCYGGEAFVHYDCALHPVFRKNGERFRVPNLRDVLSNYKNGVLYDFRRE